LKQVADFLQLLLRQQIAYSFIHTKRIADRFRRIGTVTREKDFAKTGALEFGCGFLSFSAQLVGERHREWKKFGKPVIVGEQGNVASKEEMQSADIGGAWDAKSALRMRIRNWTALFPVHFSYFFGSAFHI